MTEPVLRLLRCEAGGQTFVLETSHVRSIESVERWRRAPDSDVPVHSLAERLGLAAEDGPTVIVLGDVQPWGLLVERVAEVVQVYATQVASFPASLVGVCGGRFPAVVQLDEGPVLLIAPDRLRPDAPAEVEAPLCGPALPQAQAGAASHLVLFACGEPAPGQRPLSFGLGLAQLLEVVELPSLLKVPGAPAWVCGLAMWGERPLPVLDLALRLGLAPARFDRRSRLLIVRTSPTDAVGVVARPGARVVPLPVAHRPCTRRLPVARQRVRGAFELAGETVVVPDLAGMI